MRQRKGQRLYVNLGASQTRRRLAGFGHGVRKVESAGSNLAVIIHTATERHLEELQAKFADVGYSLSPPETKPLADAIPTSGDDYSSINVD